MSVSFWVRFFQIFTVLQFVVFSETPIDFDEYQLSPHEGIHKLDSSSVHKNKNQAGALSSWSKVGVRALQKSKNCLFEQNSGVRRITSSFVYSYPPFQIADFGGCSGTQIYQIYNYTNYTDGVPPPAAAPILSEYAFSLEDRSLQGQLSLVQDIKPKRTCSFESIYCFLLLRTDLIFSFRVLESGNYTFRANFENDIDGYNAYSFFVRTTGNEFFRAGIRSIDSSTDEFTLDTGTDFQIRIYGFISGVAGETTTSWILTKA